MKTLIFAPFQKVDKQDDGTLIVTGIASSEAEDHDGEIIRADAVRKALPDYLSFGAVREMHQPIAAGTAISASVDDDGVTHLEAHIVDAQSVKKVETGVLKGFSIGGRVTKRNSLNKNIVEALNLTEISLVDRPSNPDSIITMVKFDNSGAAISEKPAKKVVSPKVTELRKGLCSISRLADIIMSLHYLAQSAEYEETEEEDDSEVPAQLKAQCKALCVTLREMVDEETRELLGLSDEDDLLESAAKAIGKAVESGIIEKAGAKFSSSSKKTLGAVHKSLQDCVEKMNSLGYQNADNSEDRDMNKTAETSGTGTAPAAGAPASAPAADEVQKAVGAATAPLNTEIAELKVKLEKAEADKVAADALAKKAQETADGLAEQVVKSGILRAVPKSGGEEEADDQADDQADESVGKNRKAPKKPDFASEFKKTIAHPQSPIRGMAAR